MNTLSHSLLAFALMLSAVTAAAQTAETAPAAKPSRVAQMVLDSPRTQPADYVRHVVTLIDLGEAPLAQPLFQQLLGMNLDPAARASIVHQVGTAALSRMARTEALGAESEAFVRETLAGAAEYVRSPRRLAELLDQAVGNDADAHKMAVAQLSFAGQAAVSAAIDRLADSTELAVQNRLRAVLVKLAPASTPALAAALEAPQAAVQQQVAWALGQVGELSAVPRLAAVANGPQSDPAAAARWAIRQITGASFQSADAFPLLDQALDHALSGAPPAKPTSTGMVTLTWWDKQAKRLATCHLPAAAASQWEAAQLAKLLWKLNPADETLWAQAAVLGAQADWLLQQHQVEAKLEVPPVNDLPGPLLVEGLAAAGRYGLTGASIHLLKVLGDRGVVDVLSTGTGEPSAIATELQSPHPAVRFAALQAIMQLDPHSPFPGSSRVTKSLLYFAGSHGQAEAIVAMPRLNDASNVSGYLASQGVMGHATNLGKEVIGRLAQQPDVEFALLDISLLRPPVREVLFQIRREPTTAKMPVALLAGEGRLEDAKRLAREHEGVIAIPRPHSQAAVQTLVQRLQLLAPAGMPTAAERAEMATAAAGWIQRILQQGPAFYRLRAKQSDLLDAITRATEIASRLPSLAAIGTADSQAELVNMASLPALSIETRKAAADAFGKSVKQHGLLLTTQDILKQYDRYNASETADSETQSVLGGVLDTIEARRSSGS